jgi:hypothetical protein
LLRGFAITPARKYLLLAGGTYRSTATVTVGGQRWLIGEGTTRPVATNSTAGPIFTIETGTDVTFEHLEISGATNSGTTGPRGNALECPNTVTGPRNIRLVDDLIKGNASDGVVGRSCTLSAFQTVFTTNGGSGLALQDSTATLDRCASAGNQGHGLDFDAGLYAVTNSFITRNTGGGIILFTNSDPTHFDFNTIADNGGNGFECNLSNSATSNANNLIVRNQVNTFGGTCVFPGSIILATVSSVGFKSPDTQPYDYHLVAGSIAIDGATSSVTTDHDFDGDTRPKGAGRDVGADEAQ